MTSRPISYLDGLWDGRPRSRIMVESRALGCAANKWEEYQQRRVQTEGICISISVGMDGVPYRSTTADGCTVYPVQRYNAERFTQGERGPFPAKLGSCSQEIQMLPGSRRGGSLIRLSSL